MAARLALIVDDNAFNLKLLRDVLRFEGYRTAEAATATSALASAAAERPDVVLLDVGLPDMSGVDALARLRADPRTRSVPVMAVTSSAMVGDRERLIGAGFDDYLAKPVGIRDLVERVRRLCEPDA